MKTALRMLVLCLCIAPLAANAQQNKQTKSKQSMEQSENRGSERRKSLHDQFTGQGYGLAGCGLGSVVFGPKPGMIQVIAATINGWSGSQTFGISSGTSNCDLSEMGQQAAVFIEVNQVTLAKDAARGEGETIAGLASIINCSNPSLFGSKMKANYAEVFADDAGSYEKSRRIMKIINTDAELKTTCTSAAETGSNT